MATIAGALALSHGSFMISQPEMAAADAREAAFGALELARQRLLAMKPDALVVIGTDHFNTFFVDAMPSICVGVNDRYRGWADNIPMYEIGGSAQASRQLLAALDDSDVSSKEDMRLDHSFFGPLHFLTPDMAIPIIPIFQNCIAEPMRSLRDVYRFGQRLRSAVEAVEVWDRVVVIGSGGLSHWIGGPEHSRVSDQFDERFLAAFESGELAEFTEMESGRLELLAGNGGHEIRNWLAVRGCVPDLDVDVLCYRPITDWLVGFAVTVLEGAHGVAA